MKISMASSRAAAVTVVLLAVGCSSQPSTSDTPTAGVRYAIPVDICDRIDFSLAEGVFGEPMPDFGSDDKVSASAASCMRIFFGVRDSSGEYGPGGIAAVELNVFPSAAQARASWDSAPSSAVTSPLSGVPAFDVDAVRHGPDLEILDDTMRLTVKAGRISMSAAAPGPELDAVLVALAQQTLDVMRARS